MMRLWGILILLLPTIASAGETEHDLGKQIQRCWNVGALSSDAMRVSLTVGFTLGRDAKPDVHSIRILNASGADGEAVNQAYEAARRAIIRCGAQGFNLSADRYEEWWQVRMTFDALKRN